MRVKLFGDEVSKDTLYVDSAITNVGTAFVLMINSDISINFNSMEDYENFVQVLKDTLKDDKTRVKNQFGDLHKKIGV